MNRESFSLDAFSLGDCAALACLLECTAAKPGNIHRAADFEDASYLDFLLSSHALGRVFDRAASLTCGELILAGVHATRQFVEHNTNLGMILLLAPLAKVPPGTDLNAGLPAVLDALTADDCRQVYEAIRLAHPGALGDAAEADVNQAPPDDLVAAMRLAAERDLIARQYANGFHELFTEVVPSLRAGLDRGWSVQTAIIQAYVQLLASTPDTLIARKCGLAVAQEAAALAGIVLRSGEPLDDSYEGALVELDFWLRSDGHRRNPGTSADMIAAALFVLLREGWLRPPFRFYGNKGVRTQ